jgi:tRNA threonylcarbamoyladenosine biosynthesis protein TsaB
MPMIDALLTIQELKIKDFDYLLACNGPGSFTGVRIGLSAVKAFAQPYNLKIDTVNSMKLLALGVINHDGIVVSMIDAKRDEVYYGIYENHLFKTTDIEEGVLGYKELIQMCLDKYKVKPILFIGDALSVYESEIENIINEKRESHQILLGTGAMNVPRAISISNLDLSCVKSQSYFEVYANYMRKSQAERDKENESHH